MINKRISKAIIEGLFLNLQVFALIFKRSETKQEVIFQKNKKLIDDFEKLPFYKKWGQGRSLRRKIILNWRKFEYQNNK